MKTILSSRRNHYVARIGIFLIMVALVAGMVGCASVTLTLSITPTSGGTISPSAGTYSYKQNTVVSLNATAAANYRFVEWTGDDITAIADPTLPETTIKMDKDHSITAKFEQVCFTDEIGPGLWCLFEAGTGVSATIPAGKGAQVDFTPPCTNGTGGMFGESARRMDPNTGGIYSLTGDFDIQMPYELKTWPHANGVRVCLIVGVPGSLDELGIERVSWGPHNDPFPGQEVYLVDDFRGGIHNIQGSISTTDTSGSFRLLRQGNTVYCFYWDGTLKGGLGDWNLFYDRQNWPTPDVYVSVSAWSDENRFGGNAVSVLMGPVEFK
ncbi:MAG: hypothetical protein WB564_05360 [Dehalococcoidia bacterium]